MWLLVAWLPACGTNPPGGGSALCNVDANDDGFGTTTTVAASSCTDPRAPMPDPLGVASAEGSALLNYYIVGY